MIMLPSPGEIFDDEPESEVGADGLSVYSPETIEREAVVG